MRYFLGTKNQVNQDIRRAILTGSPEEFWAGNNGITLTCDQYVATAGSSFPVKLKNPRIINGGQTATVIHEVGRETPVALNGAAITIKIVETSNKSLVRRIAVASNNQSRVFDRDLRADDPFQQQLAEEFAVLGIFYRRKRGETGYGEGIPTIESMRAGQLILSYVLGEPDRAKTGSNEIFGDLYDEVFNPDRVSAEMIATAWELYRPLDEETKLATAQQRLASRNTYDEAWIIEGKFHVLFVVGQLMALSGVPLTHTARALDLVPKAKKIIADFVRDNPGIPGYRLFRLSKTARELRRRIPEYADLGQLRLPGI